MEPRWLNKEEMAAWLRLIAISELLPGVIDSHLRTQEGMNHFEYQVLAMLSEAPERTLRMTALAQRTNATLTRLSHVVKRVEERGLVRRSPCAEDARATNATLTDEGHEAIVKAAPGHVETVRQRVFDGLTAAQVSAFVEIADGILTRLDPEGKMTALLETAGE